MENYVNRRIRETVSELYKNDSAMLGNWFGFAISCWKLNHKQEIQGFRQEYKKSEKSA